MMTTRRGFLARAGALGASGLAARLAPLSALAHAASASAQSAPDYKALVCVFLYGGLDGNSVLLPNDAAGYARYAAARPSSSGLNIAQASLLPLQPSNTSVPFGLHPALAEIQPLFGQGKLALLANVGPLLRPTTRATYLASRPDNLFSHSDQQGQWQSSVSSGPSATGWGGRVADEVAPGAFPVVTSIAGNSVFITGNTSSPLALPSTGGLALQGYNGGAAANARLAAMQAILGSGGGAYVDAAAEVTRRAIALSGVVNPILTASGARVEGAFAGQSSGIAQQLLQVAKLVEAQAQTGARRQIFFVSLGGFDTHTNELATLDTLLGQLSPALRAFYDATAAIGMAERVTTFTLSDFGRTMQPASGAGSDHAWGNHHLILGGAVHGGALYGTYPSLVLGGPDDAEFEGRWIPTTSVDQYGATLARWFGLDDAALARAFPNLSQFPAGTLAFV